MQYILDTLPKKKPEKNKNGNYKIILETRWSTEEYYIRSMHQAEKLAAKLTRIHKDSRAEIKKV